MSFQTPSPPNEPEEDQSWSAGLPRGVIILVLLAIGSVAAIIPLYFVLSTIRADTTQLQSEIQVAQRQLSETSTPDPEIQTLQAQLAEAEASVTEMEQAFANLGTDYASWPAVMEAIGDYEPNNITLNTLSQDGSRLTLEGQGSSDSVVIAYADRLEESNLFSRVVLQSLRSIATPFASPTPTGAATVTPTMTVTPTASPTSTPSPLDEYETDDFEPNAIFLGQTQRHNFYPVYDIDKVVFLAKADRFYRVYTSDLAPGVDTFLHVDANGVIYTNDDRSPGQLASEVVFQAPESRDVDATVKVTNRGQYGPDMFYQLTVEEIIPTPTPTPTGTPPPSDTPLPSDTPEPSDTPLPSDTPEPTEPSPSIDDVSPQQGSTAQGAIDVTIVGSNFDDPGVFLTGVGADIEATELSVTAGQRINCRFDLSGEPAGVRNVLVVNADGKSVELVNAFEVVSPTPTSSPTATLAPTASSSLRGPGLAASVYAMRAPNAQAVEFVIILELREATP